MLQIAKNSDGSAEKTAEVLCNGGIAVLPTDTVYGFSGIVSTALETDAHIRAIKGRAETKPLIQLISKPEDINLYTNDAIPPALLAKWPGALTIIVNTKETAHFPLHDKFPTIAFRCPGDPWLRKVISLCSAPIFSTSVNRSGQPVLDTTAEICAEFASEIDLFVNDGDKKGALPSTLVTLENGSIKVLRQGSVEV